MRLLPIWLLILCAAVNANLMVSRNQIFAASHALLVDTDCALDAVLGHHYLGQTLRRCPSQMCPMHACY